MFIYYSFIYIIIANIKKEKLMKRKKPEVENRDFWTEGGRTSNHRAGGGKTTITHHDEKMPKPGFLAEKKQKAEKSPN